MLQLASFSSSPEFVSCLEGIIYTLERCWLLTNAVVLRQHMSGKSQPFPFAYVAFLESHFGRIDGKGRWKYIMIL
jgi:hypothetical protein